MCLSHRQFRNSISRGRRGVDLRFVDATSRVRLVSPIAQCRLVRFLKRFPLQLRRKRVVANLNPSLTWHTQTFKPPRKTDLGIMADRSLHSA
jgi:hypothetical protein